MFISPDEKPFWQDSDLKKIIRRGYPVFKFGRALGLKRFIPSENFIDSFISNFSNTKIVDKNKINIFKKDYISSNGNIGKFESLEEQEKRYKYELLESKIFLKKS